MLVAVLFTNYGPYHLARINSFQTACAKVGWNLLGIELARSEAEYQWKTQTENLPYKMISVLGDRQLESVKFTQVCSNLIATLDKTRPDVLAIAGYARPAMLSALLWSIWNRKPAILFSATTENDAPRSWWREIFKTSLIKQYRAALAGGKPQKRYLIKLGMPADAVFVGYDVVGNDAFHPTRIQSLSHPLNKPFFLTINRFVPKKNLAFLISSYAEYRKIAGDNAWDLVLCGDGPLRSQIEQQIADLNLEKCIHLPGFLQQDEMLPYFAHAGCFVHASIKEQWGLVVNEAMAAGLPILVSNRCGCFEDLVLEGINGFGFDPENAQQLTNLMLTVSSQKKLDLSAMGQASLQHIQKYSPDYFAQNLIQAVEYAIAH
jgi:1,2-diacylglycerol 3-alpha-glucosyltransferase